MKEAFFVAGLLLLAGCVSPASREASMRGDASACLKVGMEIDQAKACLKSRGLDISTSGINRVLVSNCGPYWGLSIGTVVRFNGGNRRRQSRNKLGDQR